MHTTIARQRKGSDSTASPAGVCRGNGYGMRNLLRLAFFSSRLRYFIAGLLASHLLRSEIRLLSSSLLGEETWAGYHTTGNENNAPEMLHLIDSSNHQQMTVDEIAQEVETSSSDYAQRDAEDRQHTNLRAAPKTLTPVEQESASTPPVKEQNHEGNQHFETAVTSVSLEETKKVFQPDPIFLSVYDEMSKEDPKKRCERYGYSYNPDDAHQSNPRRRIFFGSMVADDSIDVMEIHATEAYNMYDVMVLSESNRTHLGTSRPMRFETKGQEAYDFVHSGAFGNDESVKIRMSYYRVPEEMDRTAKSGMRRERQQRNTIVDAWVAEGMTEDDIGIMSDMDEVFTRDFLIALKECVLPDPLTDRSCRQPKLLAHSISFEMSPECVRDKAWYHPDLMLGVCIEGVGSTSDRVAREYDENFQPKCGYGGLCPQSEVDKGEIEQYGFNEEAIKNGNYPLWSGSDIREGAGGKQQRVINPSNDEGKQHSATAFHFHNWFPDLQTLRNKYYTYAHYNLEVMKKSMAGLHEDIEMAMRCAYGLPNELFPDLPHYRSKSEVNSGSRPIYFREDKRRERRHKTLLTMMMENEESHGPTYSEEEMSHAKATGLPATKSNKKANDGKAKGESFTPDPLFQTVYNRLKQGDTSKRCERYGYSYDKDAPKRRLFFGSMVADESIEVLKIHATESYGLYDVMVLSESNRTHLGTSREMRFEKRGQKAYDFVRGGAFGDSVKIHMSYWRVPEETDRTPTSGMRRERLQRNTIVDGWIAEGMTEDDIGIMSDMDEVLTRDFLMALKDCVLPTTLTDKSCRQPKLLAHSISYEMSPECAKPVDGNSWHHPDLMLGRCIEGVGNADIRVPKERLETLLPKCGYGGVCPEELVTKGEIAQYGFKNDAIKNGYYPLWSGSDIREGVGGIQQKIEKDDEEKHSVTAFHFHNWFPDLETLRQKYYSYAHYNVEILDAPMGGLHEDTEMAMRCAFGLPNELFPGMLAYENNTMSKEAAGSKPIYFLDEKRRKRRHKRLLKMALENDEKHGPSYGEAEMSHATFERKVTGSSKSGRNTEAGDTTRGHEKGHEVPHLSKGVIRSASEAVEVFFDNGDPHSKTATVISFAYGYPFAEFRKFIGSLRATGYLGHILLFVKPNLDSEIGDYLKKKNATVVETHLTNCTHGYDEERMKDIQHNLVCIKPFSEIKMRWAKYPLSLDWLKSCESCTGPVIITDFRDVFFQRDPFHGTKVTGLQVFEESKIDTTHWLTQWPIHDCYGVDTNKDPRPMICSGTTVGTRDAMLSYLEAMYQEMKLWTENEKCHVRSDADDQSIHNYLVYYKNEVLPKPLYLVKFRTGIVNTIGSEASIIWNRDEELRKEVDEGRKKKEEVDFHLKYGDPWLAAHLGLTDEEGYLVQRDNITRSRVVHQIDRFGPPYNHWLDRFEEAWK